MEHTRSVPRIAAFIIILLAILFVAHAVIYLALSAAWPALVPFPDIQIKLVLTLLAVGSVGMLVVASRFNDAITRIGYLFFSLWMGLFVYLFLGAALYGIVIGIAGLAGMGDTFPWLARSIGLVAVLVTVGGILNAWPIRTRAIKASFPNLPAAWKGKRAVFVSDVHLGQIHTARFSRRVVNEIQKHKPDIVLIGGDLYDGVKVDEAAVIAPFADLKAPMGTFFITGNHEEFTDSSHFLNAIRALGIRVLANVVTDVEGVQLVGVNDHDSADRAVYADLMSKLPIDRSRPAILLKHQPSYLEYAEKAGISLQLSGHTHRAQLWPLNILPFFIYKGYSYGPKKHGSLKVYTSSGVGSWGPPIRVGSSSEIVVIEFS